MKEIDDTEPPKSESEVIDEMIEVWVDPIWEALERLSERIDAIDTRIANLEARKPPQDTNPDPEWYS